MKVPREIAKLYGDLDLREKNVVVMFSGGPDSVYMLQTLVEYGCASISLVFINYTNADAAPMSEANLQFALQYARTNHLSIMVHTVDIGKDYDLGKGPEGNCRMAKKDVINQLVGDPFNDYIMLGHNLDDHIETILLQLMRGAGKGTRGIPDMVRGKIVRPLIEMKKADIVAECDRYGFGYFTDAQNDNTDCSRQFMRHEIIPKLVEHYGAGTYKRICNIGKKFE